MSHLPFSDQPEFPFASTRLRLSRRRLVGAGTSLVAHPTLVPGEFAVAQRATPVTSSAPRGDHPRIWITPDELPRLRRWATGDNPIWRDGILVLAAAAVDAMDSGDVPARDEGSTSWEEYPTEMYAEFFALLSLVHPDETMRDDFGARARTLLMSAIDESAKGVADAPFRQPEFAIADRSRWWGEAWAVTIDWIYPRLSAADKETIRSVFLRWADENAHAETTSFNHPEPVGTTNDAALFSDPVAARWAGNNYFLAHMRNIGLMALVFDLADDPDGSLTGQLDHAIGAWLFMVDHLIRTDSRGGLAPEGFEYSQQAMAYLAQFLLALETAGQADPSRWGPQVAFDATSFWDDLLTAYHLSLSPGTVVIPNVDYLGPLHQPAWYGDGQQYWGPDFITVFGPIVLHDDRAGNMDRRDALRWTQIHMPPGGADALIPNRIAGTSDFLSAMLYFLMLDPTAAPPADPRPRLPLHHVAEGLGRVLVRTSWDDDATLFTWALSWNTIDHQHNDGNEVAFYRNGEWLTKERTGYGMAIGASDYHNTLALENDPPSHNEDDDYRHLLWQRGSQWPYEPAGDPAILALGISDSYVYGHGDATNLYNSTYEEVTDIRHASRSVVWLRPDRIVIFDRAISKTEGRFKRFWLNLPAAPVHEDNRSIMTTAHGQHLTVTTLLPADAAIASEPADAGEEAAEGEPMQYRLRVEAPGGPRRVNFLHVLQGTDPGVDADVPDLIASTEGTSFAGALVGTVAILFPVSLDEPFAGVAYTVPVATSLHLVTGLAPRSAYGVEITTSNDTATVRVVVGGALRSGEDGVLEIHPPS